MLLLSACASSPPWANPLDEWRMHQVKEMVMHCYGSNDGLRLVHGDAAIYGACRNWAEARLGRR